MKTIKILFISFLAIVLMSFQCEAEEPTVQTTECNCVEVRYTLSPGDTGYQYHSTINRTDLTCEDETTTINYNGSYHVRIDCE